MIPKLNKMKARLVFCIWSHFYVAKRQYPERLEGLFFSLGDCKLRDSVEEGCKYRNMTLAQLVKAPVR